MPIRQGLPFAPAKGSKTGQRGTRLSPLQSPLALGCAGYERCKHRPYCAQMRSKGSHRRICPLSPAPSPAIGGGDVYPNPCLPSLSSRQLLSALSAANLPFVASPQVIFPRRNAISFPSKNKRVRQPMAFRTFSSLSLPADITPRNQSPPASPGHLPLPAHQRHRR